MTKPLTAILTLALLLVLQGCQERPAEPAAAKGGAAPQVVIVAAGDSLTAGLGVAEEEAYPARLEAKLRAAGLDCRVINAGSSGETSSGLLSRLEWLLTLKPAIVILESGANDGLRGVDPGLTKRNLKAMIGRLKARGIVVVLAGMRMVENLGPAYTEAFDRIYPEIAKEEPGVIFMPFFLEGVATVPGLNGPDGIHPNPAGYRVVVDNLYPYVVQAIDRVKAGPRLDQKGS